MGDIKPPEIEYVTKYWHDEHARQLNIKINELEEAIISLQSVKKDLALIKQHLPME